MICVVLHHIWGSKSDMHSQAFGELVREVSRTDHALYTIQVPDSRFQRICMMTRQHCDPIGDLGVVTLPNALSSVRLVRPSVRLVYPHCASAYVSV